MFEKKKFVKNSNYMVLVWLFGILRYVGIFLTLLLVGLGRIQTINKFEIHTFKNLQISKTILLRDWKIRTSNAKLKSVMNLKSL